jgi:delta 1-pyrroline-5-carboxylate dehydrogenase
VQVHRTGPPFTERAKERMMHAFAWADQALQTWAAPPCRKRSQILGRSAAALFQKMKNSLAAPQF